MSVIDVASQTVTHTITVGDWPQDVAFAPDGTVAYVAHYELGQVSVIDVASQTVTVTIPAGDGPESVAFSPDGTMAYVTARADDAVGVIGCVR